MLEQPAPATYREAFEGWGQEKLYLGMWSLPGRDAPQEVRTLKVEPVWELGFCKNRGVGIRDEGAMEPLWAGRDL